MKISTIKEQFLALSARFGKGASEEQILLCEKNLIKKLPPSYRSFLAHFGWAEIGLLCIAGLGEDAPEDLLLSRVAKAAWEEGNVSTSLLAFAEEGAGNVLWLDSSSSLEYEVVCQIDEKETLLLAPSFGAWLEDELSGLLVE